MAPVDVKNDRNQTVWPMVHKRSNRLIVHFTIAWQRQRRFVGVDKRTGSLITFSLRKLGLLIPFECLESVIGTDNEPRGEIYARVASDSLDFLRWCDLLCIMDQIIPGCKRARLSFAVQSFGNSY
ncbi:hypothetical protein BASA61_004343 [Batrachochytrium salamandrivorans]|nr:hypothetical protein BASA61_004343 [Batrachochytrium salamandrivorans]